MKPIVYIDVLFLLNFFMNTVTLYISSLLISQQLKIRRLLIGAVFLSLYACIMFFPRISFIYSIAGKLIILFTAAALTFSIKSRYTLFKNAVVLFAVSMLLGGIIFTLIFATSFGTTVGSAVSNGEIYINITPSTLIFSIFIAYSCIYVISALKNRNAINKKQILDLSIHFRSKKISLRALLDTGCALCDPISLAPAIIISRQSANELLPKSFFDFCDSNGNIESPDRDFARYRILPFSTIDCKRGFLYGFIPDIVLVNNKTVEKSVIAVSDYALSPEANFDAILGPLILERTDII